MTKGKVKGKGGGCPSLHSPAELAFYGQAAVHNLLFFLAETLRLSLSGLAGCWWQFDNDLIMTMMSMNDAGLFDDACLKCKERRTWR